MPFSGSTSRKRPRSGSESAGARRRSASSQRRPRPSPPPTRSYADPGEVPQLPLAWAFAGAWARVQRMRKEAAADAIPLRLSEQFSTLRLRQRRETSGDARFNEVMRTLDQFADVHGAPLVRSPLQRNFHLHMANAAVAAIYGNDFDASQKRILEKYQWDDFRQEVMIITARGEGKTYAVAMFVASVLMRCPGITVSVFAVSMRASENVVRLVRAMLLSHPDGERMLQRQKSGKQSLQLLGAGGEGDIRVVTALPNSPDTTRGVHSDFMIVDEASFVDPALMMETIIPTTTKRRTCVIMISTPKGQDNIYTWLTDLVDTGVNPPRPLFNVVRAGKVCAACIEADTALSCTHMRATTPSWKSDAKIARMKVLFADRPDLELMEIKGVSADSERAAFSRASVDGMLNNVARGIDATTIKCVYVAVDPSGGGSSEFAAAAFVEDAWSRLSVRPHAHPHPTTPPPSSLLSSHPKHDKQTQMWVTNLQATVKAAAPGSRTRCQCSRGWWAWRRGRRRTCPPAGRR